MFKRTVNGQLHCCILLRRVKMHAREEGWMVTTWHTGLHRHANRAFKWQRVRNQIPFRVRFNIIAFLRSPSLLLRSWPMCLPLPACLSACHESSTDDGRLTVRLNISQGKTCHVPKKPNAEQHCMMPVDSKNVYGTSRLQRLNNTLKILKVG